MVRLLALLEKQIGKSWIEIGEWLRTQDANAIDAIEARLVVGDYAGVVQSVEAAGARFAADTQQAYVTAGQRAAKWLDDQPALADKLVTFDGVNERAVQRARVNRYELVRGFTEEQRTIARNIIVDGMQRGENPRVMARDLRDSIGLTATQEQHIRNYRRALETGRFADARERQLHDDRYNRTLDRGEPLTPQQIDKMVGRYRQNYIAHRAEVISRTEALRAANEGSEELFRQAIERGDVTAAQLVKTWHAGPATRDARASHQAMDGVSVPVLDPFVLPDGTRLMHPGDPAGGAHNNAQCRCTVSRSFAA